MMALRSESSSSYIEPAGERNRVCFGDGRGAFERAIVFGAAADKTFCVQAGDLDGDGRLDIAVANSGGQSGIYRNRVAASK